MPDVVTVLGGSPLAGGTLLEGTAVKLEVTAVDFNNAPIDPATIRLLVLRPGDAASQVIGTYVENSACVGVVLIDKPGMWRYRFEATVGSPAAYEGMFTATPRQVPAPA